MTVGQQICNKLGAIKDKIKQFGTFLRKKYNKNKRKCKGTIIVFSVLLLVTGLILACYDSVDSLSQGVSINNTQGVIDDENVYNHGQFIGLASSYKQIPNTYLLVAFDSSFTPKQKNQEKKYQNNAYPSLIGRVKQGINLQIKVHAKAKMVPTNIKNFMDNYGAFEEDIQGWQLYLKEKIKNSILQKVASFRFYELTNKALKSEIDTEFSTYQATLSYPFFIRIESINIRYPQFKTNTLGVSLLEKSSLVSQLTTQLSNLQAYISEYDNSTTNVQKEKAQIDAYIRNRQIAVDVASEEWIEGMQIFNQTVANDTLLQKYLEVYFRNIYGVKYRVQTLQPFQI